MIDTVSGLYIEREYITLVRADQDTGGISNMEIVPLDTDVTYDKSVIEGLKQLKKSGSLLKGEKVFFAFQSEQSILFQTKLAPEVDDIHEAMSWELLNRTDQPLDSFTFVTLPLEESRAFGIAQDYSDVKKHLKYLKKVGIKPAGLSVPVVSLVNLLEMNYGAGKETILFNISAPCSSVIYIKDGVLWDVQMIYGLDESTSPKELVDMLLEELAELKRKWSVPAELLTRMTGSLITNAQMKAEIVKALPNCYELNCFELVKNNTGNDLNTISMYNPIVSIAAGLAVSGVAQ